MSPFLPTFSPFSHDLFSRTSTGRTRAFLLFLAGLPQNQEARQGRQEWLGRENDNTIPSLILHEAAEQPGNRVIASASDLRELRKAINQGDLQDEMADEYGIPPKAVEALRRKDSKQFIEERNSWLIEEEKSFIRNLGLKLSDED